MSRAAAATLDDRLRAQDMELEFRCGLPTTLFEVKLCSAAGKDCWNGYGAGLEEALEGALSQRHPAGGASQGDFWKGQPPDEQLLASFCDGLPLRLCEAHLSPEPGLASGGGVVRYCPAQPVPGRWLWRRRGTERLGASLAECLPGRQVFLHNLSLATGTKDREQVHQYTDRRWVCHLSRDEKLIRSVSLGEWVGFGEGLDVAIRAWDGGRMDFHPLTIDCLYGTEPSKSSEGAPSSGLPKIRDLPVPAKTFCWNLTALTESTGPHERDQGRSNGYRLCRGAYARQFPTLSDVISHLQQTLPHERDLTPLEVDF